MICGLDEEGKEEAGDPDFLESSTSKEYYDLVSSAVQRGARTSDLKPGLGIHV